LELRENNFDWQIPTDLGLLQSLTLLDISDLESITEASIPSEVGNLSSLKTFYTNRSSNGNCSKSFLVKEKSNWWNVVLLQEGREMIHGR